MTSDEELRLLCLQMALEHPSSETAYINAAAAHYAFVKGESLQDIADLLAEEHVPKPGQAH